MKIWPVRDAEAHFSQMLAMCAAEGSQLVSKRGEMTAVLVPIAQWEKLQAARRPRDLKELLLSDAYLRCDLEIPPRVASKMREPPQF